jgi:hypothetical protein
MAIQSTIAQRNRISEMKLEKHGGTDEPKWTNQRLVYLLISLDEDNNWTSGEVHYICILVTFKTKLVLD